MKEQIVFVLKLDMDSTSMKWLQKKRSLQEKMKQCSEGQNNNEQSFSGSTRYVVSDPNTGTSIESLPPRISQATHEESMPSVSE